MTIEVRFITLNDNFFERIGVDFDFNIDDNVGVNPAQSTGADRQPVGSERRPIGCRRPATGDQLARTSPPTWTSPSARTASRWPCRSSAASSRRRRNFGFAILSDIEAYFFINAAQGDRRSNVLQAPKVTLFNGQQAFVSDTSQRPFVISVIPVVGDFAAAQQPVIVVLSEGTFLTVQAVVSNDRRFVRLTVVPFFSKIGDVNTFTLQRLGRRRPSSTRAQSTTTKTATTTKQRPKCRDHRSGTTVQLPTFSFVTVTTTVSVPDGGTVLLGGIKRLSEGRNEFGVPILNKMPYINRLFKNVGIGRETQSLMMMVTPRIIIQEEEEERLGVATEE